MRRQPSGGTKAGGSPALVALAACGAAGTVDAMNKHSTSTVAPAHINDRNRLLALERRTATSALADVDPTDRTTIARLRRRVADAESAAMSENFRLVRAVVGPFARHQKASREDLESAGMEALLRAFRKYDPDWVGRHGRPVAFAAVAHPEVYGAVRREVNTTEGGGSYGDFSTRPKAQSAREDLRRTLGREPTWQEIDRHLGLPAGRAQHALRPSTLSLSAPLGADDDRDMLDRVADSPDGSGSSDPRLVERLDALFGQHAERLERDELVAVAVRYGLGPAAGVGLSEVAHILELDRETARKSTAAAAKKLVDAAPEPPRPTPDPQPAAHAPDAAAGLMVRGPLPAPSEAPHRQLSLF